MNFWTTLPRPFTALAPMEDITDTVFRSMVDFIGGPEVYFTEFIPVRDLPNPRNKFAQQRSWFEPGELSKPLVAQLWGVEPELFRRAGILLRARGFHGIDINMGCPQPRVVRRGGGAALINDPVLAREIILATREGSGLLPVSVKTRLGYSYVATEEWLGFLLDLDLPALSIHGRIQSQLYGGEADWGEIKKVVDLRNAMKKSTVILGNGDISAGQDFRRRWEQTGADGFMVGRGILKDPGLLRAWPTGPRRGYPDYRPFSQWSREEKLALLLRHMEEQDRVWGHKKGHGILKKFFKTYCSHFPAHEELRLKLMKSRSSDEARMVIRG